MEVNAFDPFGSGKQLPLGSSICISYELVKILYDLA